MKTLLLIRHAKSDWHTGLPDHDRPLNTRGARNAPDMAKRMVARGITPELLISSSAIRAHTTAQAMQTVFETPNISIHPKLYACTAHTGLNVIHALPDELNCIAIYGHDPAISSVVTELTQQPTHMPTCAVAQCEFNVTHWADASAHTLTRYLIDTPKKPYSP